MSTNFPSSIDTFTNPTSVSAVTVIDHAAQHENINDAVLALQNKVGANSSAVTTSFDFKLSGVATGDKAVSLIGTQTMTNKSLADSSTSVVNASDVTKVLKFSIGNTTGITGIFATAFTTAKTITFPDSTDTLVGKATTDTLTNKTIVGSNNTISGISEAMMSFTDITTLNVSTSKHGFVPKAPNDSTQFFRGDGTWAVPSGGIPSGSVTEFAGSSVPSGWLFCDGSAVSRSTYSGLFTAIGTTYGAGDGSTTFNLPDSRGRVIQGVGTGAKVATWASRASNVITVTGLTNSAQNEFQTGQAVTYVSSGTVMTGLVTATVYYVIRLSNSTFSLATSAANAIAGTAISLSSDGSGTQTFTLTFTARALGDTGGEEAHGLVIGEITAHNHPNGIASGGNQVLANSSGNSSFQNTGNTGGSGLHLSLNPFLALNVMIKT